MKKPYLLWAAVLLALLAAILGVRYFGKTHVVLEGKILPPGQETADLRNVSMTLADYEEIREKLPQCEVLWEVPVGTSFSPSNADEMTLADVSAEELSRVLPYFPDLTHLTLTGVLPSVQELETLQQEFPGITLDWTVSLAGQAYPQDVSELTLENAPAEELTQALPYFTGLTRLTLTGELPTVSQLETLQAAFPQITMGWVFEALGRELTSEETALDLSGKQLTLEEADALLAMLPKLEWAGLDNTGLTEGELKILADTYPNCLIPRTVTVAGLSFRTDVEEMDLTGGTLGSLAELEAVLPYFRNLKKVDMTSYAFSNEEMDQLNKRWDPIRFIWTIRIRGYRMRTDATWFYPYKFDKNLYVNNNDVYPLRYCEDMVCIDIGHNGEVTDCEWAAFMPELKYLIIGETGITDLTPLANCKKLEYLEMFTIKVTDFSPLVSCTSLKDLNIGKVYGDPAPIAQMTWLEKLWWCDSMNKAKFSVNMEEYLTQALPNTLIKFYPEHPTASGWRQQSHYTDMRDFMGMFYLT